MCLRWDREDGLDLMRKRRVGNWLKSYPHIYEMFRGNIAAKNVSWGLMITLAVFLAFFALVFWALGYKDDGMFFIIILTPVVIILLASGNREMISLEEVELMERDLAGEKERIGDWYSTEESFLIGFYRFPRGGLSTVYLDWEMRRGRHGPAVAYMTAEFYYEDGTHLSMEIRKTPKDSDCEDFVRLVHRYDDSVRIYRHKRMMEKFPLFLPFQKLMAEEPYVEGNTLEELSALGQKDILWRIRTKSRSRHDGNREVEVVLYGTVLTWFLYLAWLCAALFLVVYAFYLASEAMLIAFLLGAGICYYLVFVRSGRKLTGKAKEIFYKSCG